MIMQMMTFTRVILHKNVRSRFHPHLPTTSNPIETYTFNITCRSFSFNSFSFRNLGRTLRSVLPKEKKRSSIIAVISSELKDLKTLFRFSSVIVLRSCIKQLEFVTAHRIRRGQQFMSLYSQMWDEKSLKVFLNCFRRRLFRKGKEVLVSASVVAFNWEKDRISDEELQRHLDELDLCHILRKRANEKAETCSGPECQCAECKTPEEVKCWSPFINKDELTVWKMEEKNHKGTGLFCYKMYGKYDDVLAQDFLKVFLDTENRKKWDAHAVRLEVIDREPSTNSDVLYWETKWPKLFSNRDYIFTRRFMIDPKKEVMIIMNKSATHPNYPEQSNKSRVYEYWSYMVIKPLKSFDKEGIEFSLTYFDNPGVTLPSAISLWVTVTGMPEYLKRLRTEALKLSAERAATGAKLESLFPEVKPVPPSGTEDPSKKDKTVEKKDKPVKKRDKTVEKKETPVEKKEGDVEKKEGETEGEQITPSDNEESKKESKEKDDKSKPPPDDPPCQPPSDSPPFKQPLDPIVFWITCMTRLKALFIPKEPVVAE